MKIPTGWKNRLRRFQRNEITNNLNERLQHLTQKLNVDSINIEKYGRRITLTFFKSITFKTLSVKDILQVCLHLLK